MRRNRSKGRKRLGHNLVICDYSGWKCWDDEVIETWDGHYVHKRFWEERHPQDFVRGKVDDESVNISRPESPDVTVCEGVYEDGVYDVNQQMFQYCVTGE